MKHPIYRFLGRYIPQPLAPLVLRATETFRKRTRKKTLPTNDQKEAVIKQHGKFSVAELGTFLSDWGISTGDLLMVQSSLDNMFTYRGTAMQTVSILKELVGINGTLMMPASPLMTSAKDNVFDIKKTPTDAGIISEVFRRAPGVVRSYQQRAVSAFGHEKDYLVSEHHLSPYACGTRSPYAKLARKNGKILCMGVEPTTNTMFHCGEDILKDRFPVNVYFKKPSLFRVRCEKGFIKDIPYYNRKFRWDLCCDSSRMLQYFDESIIQHKRLKGVDFYLTFADSFLDRILTLANNGVHMYGLRFPDKEKIPTLSAKDPMNNSKY